MQMDMPGTSMWISKTDAPLCIGFAMLTKTKGRESFVVRVLRGIRKVKNGENP
jgi:hypothetical protein